MIYNIYCDESCHIEHDRINVMVLGAIYCPQNKLQEINQRIKSIKARNSIAATTEMKWVKISPAKVEAYKDLVNYYFDDDDLHFRAVLIPDKSQLDHERFQQDHDTWYYKMYYEMLNVIFTPDNQYEIYIDIKDTNSYEKSQVLRDVCCNSHHDFSHRIIKRIQPVRSDEIQIMQLVDILIGAVGYHNRSFDENHKFSQAKLEIVELIRARSSYSLEKSTLLREEKFNLLVWNAR